MSTQLKAFIKHDDLPDEEGPNTVAMIVDESVLATDDSAKFIEAVGEAVDAARKRVAGDHLVDYSSFRSDSAYLDRVDEVVREMSIERVELVGDRSTFSVLVADEDGEESSCEATGVTSAEAAFQALWARAVADGEKPGKDFETFLETLACDFEVLAVEPSSSGAPTP